MTNDNLFIMKKGSKPGDTPTLGTNVYYDTATNPLVICDDDIDNQNTIACYEVRNDWVLPLKGIRSQTSGVAVDNGSGYATSVDTINVDGGDPRDLLEVGWHTYKSDGTFIGTIKSMAYDGTHGTIVFTTNIQTALANNDIIYRQWGVSNSKTYNVLNRIYPNDSTSVDLYLENLNNTPGYRIDCASYQSDGSTLSTGVSLASLDIATNDYFVMINNLDPLKHHIAKITEITTNDVAGDSFEFNPKYGSEIPKGTKFAIYKGPLVTDTGVVAVGYGLYGNAQNYGTDSDETDGTGTATDARHAGLTQISAPNFYFYNNRLNKKNELNHNTKYMLHYSRSTASTHSYFRTFLTCQDYGLKVVDYGPYTMNATLTDKSREFDSISSTPQSTDHYSASVSETYTVDVEDWDRCFTNNKRNTKNLIRQWSNNRVFTATSQDSNAYPEGTFTGPTRYLHYTTSPNACSSIPDVLEMEVFDSINESGSYVDMVIADAKRIYGRKLKQHDKITIKKIIGRDNLDENFKALPGKWNASAGGTEFTVELDTGQDLRILLQKTTASGTKYETLLIGNYYYFITGIAAPVNGNIRNQVITIGGYKGKTDATFVGGGTIQETFTDSTGYRRAWSVLTESLLTDVSIDTDVTYSNIGTATQSSTITYANQTISSNNSRLYNSELLLQGGYLFNYSIPIEYGDKTHKILKLQSPRKQMYQDETLGNENLLEYFIGDYAIMKTIFVGRIESLEDYIEQGMFKYKLSGRGNINKLLGPIVNKDYKHTEDIIYSTIGPFERITNLGFSSIMASNTVNMVGIAGLTTHGTISGVSIGDLLFTQEGYFIGRIKDLTGGITLEEGTLVNLYDRVNGDTTQTLYVVRPNRNSISLAKAMSKNTITSNSVSSLTGTANKGLFFTNGNKLTDDAYGRPNVEGATLVGTSSNTHAKALGYYLNQPNSVSLDDAFFADLKDELTPANIEKHTVNSLTEYEIVSLESGEGTTLIAVAPNCPIVMGRIDENPADTTLETLTISAYKFAGAESEGEYGAFTIDGAPAAMYTALNNKHLYLSDGAYLGKMLGLEYKTASDAYITTDRKLPRDISANEYIYTSTEKTNGLYLINTQGLRSGGVLQLVNSELSTEGRPIIYNASLDTNSNGNLNYNDLSYRHGGFTYRYINLQKTNKGGLSYIKHRLDTGEASRIYSRESGEYNAYAPSYRIIPGIATTQTINDMGINNDYTNSYEKQNSPETRGIYSASGGNFADHTIYPTGNLNTDYDLLPKLSSPTIGGHWNKALDVGMLGVDKYSSNEAILGIKDNAISHAKDGWGIIDPKTITPFLFAPSDLWPDSMKREHHIGNISRNFTDYGIVLRSEPRKVRSQIKHRNYSGEANYLEEKDTSYQTLNISDSSINTNEMKRLGLMRLIECTYDWHFNLVDPENPPTAEDLVDKFDYSVYQKVIASGCFAAAGYSLSDTTIITYATSSSSGSTIDPRTAFPSGDGGAVYDNKGNYIGTVSSSNANSITLTAAAKRPNGSLYTGELYHINDAAKGNDGSGNNNYTTYSYLVSGRGGKDSFIKVNLGSKYNPYGGASIATTALKLHMLQGGIFNTDGDEGESGDVNDGYGQGSNNEFDNYFVGKMDLAFSDAHDVGKGNCVVLPPVFTGFELIRMQYTIGGSGSNNMSAAESRSVGQIRTTSLGGTTYNTETLAFLTGEGGVVALKSGRGAAGDKVYTENGELIGTLSSSPYYDSGSISSTSTTHYLNFKAPGILCDVDSGTGLYIGGQTNGAGDFIARGSGSVASGGFHPLAKKSEIAHEGSPTNEYTHPSRVMEALKHEMPIRGKATHVKEFFKPLTVTGTTYAAVNGSPDTITSSANNFITAGFEKGMIILVSGSSESANNTTHIIAGVTAGTLTLSTNTSLTNDGAGDTWTIKAMTGGSLGNSVYNGLRAVVLKRFKIEMTGDYKADIGSSTKINTNHANPALMRKMGNVNETTQTVYKPSFLALGTEEIFAYHKLTESLSATKLNRGSDVDTGENVADGINYVFKPLLQTADSDVTKNYGYISPNGQTDLTQLVIDTSDTTSGTIIESKNKWLEFVPNLTGCYLVSNDGVRIEDGDNQTGSNIWATSIERRYPSKIHYIVSHTIRTDSYPTDQDGLWNKHVLLIDNCASSGELDATYRIMRPANVCLWPNSPTKIDLYKMTSKYTKRPDSSEMYKEIGDIRYYENGFLRGDESSANYNEGVQSMYVPVNPDHTSTSNRFLIPRGTSGNHGSTLFGDGNTFSNESYDMLMNDGIEKNRRSIIFNTQSKEISGTKYYTSIDYGQAINNKMSGVVSLGEIFTLTSNQEVNLKNVTTASIGTTVTVGMEAEQIINDVLEENKIVYTDTDTEFPYFVAPNIQGSDAYNTIKYLGNFKDKELSFNKDAIEFIPKNYTYRQSNIEISEANSNIQVVELSRNKSGFDIYNEVIVYGNGIKSIKRNSKSIKEIGKKSLEEFDDQLTTQSEVDNRAKALLQLHSSDSQRITFTVSEKNLELLESGDIITIDWPSQHIPRAYYVVLEIRHSISGLLEIEAGSFRKGLEGTLAQMIVQQKKVESFLRSNRFKTPIVNEGHFESFRVKPIKLVIKRTSTSGSTQIGLTTALGFTTTLDIGTTTVTEELNEEYT